ncbi:MAG: flagellar motor switch protein FliM [Acidimicrobiales bacterium]
MSGVDSGVAEVIKPRKAPKLFDFRQPKTLERNQLKALELLFEAFARPASSVLGANLRLPSRIEVEEVDQRTWEELLTDFTDPASVSVFNLAPLPSRAILTIPAQLSLLMVDLRLGGSGTEPQELRNPTDIEQVIISSVVGELIAQIPNSFSSLVDIRIERLHQEQALQFVQGVQLNEMCVTVKFSMVIGEREPEGVYLILPFPLLRPILDLLGNRSAQAIETHSEEFSTALQQRLRDTVVEAKVVFNPTYLTSGEILELVPGDVVRLGHRQGAALDVMVDGVKLYRAQPTQLGSRVGVLLVEEEN